jgi:hypothetical protein
MQTNQSLASKPVKSFGDLLCDAFKQAIPEWYEGLLEEYSPRAYTAYKAAKDIEPYFLPQDKPILDVFVGLTNIVGVVDIGNGVARRMAMSNPPYA